MVKYTQENLDEHFRWAETNVRWAEINDHSLCKRFDDLSGLDLSGLDFKNYDLRLCTLMGSNLKGADLSNAIIGITTSFEDAIFDENTKMPFVQSVCPEEGAFIGYKKALNQGSECIVKLLIPEDAKRSSGLESKCRCNKAAVLDIKLIELDYKDVSEAESLYDRNFVYRVGETIEVKDFDECRWHTCAPGIHFYMEPISAILH